MTWLRNRDIDDERPKRERPEDEAMIRHEDCAIGMKRLKEIYRRSSDEAHC